MNSISDLTYKVVAFPEIPDFNTDECVQWALEMVFLGYETPSLLMLAGLTTPTNYFQTIEYLKDALSELGLQTKKGPEAIISYSSYYIKKIAASEAVKENLYKVYKLSQGMRYEEPIYDFSLLYWAWGDLDYGNEYQGYWEGATKDNIEAIVVETAKKWLEQNMEHYAQQPVVAKTGPQ